MDIPFRKLRGYAFDPSLSSRLDTFQINEITYEIPWEPVKCTESSISGEYLEIIDYDPSVKQFYKTLNLDDREVLAQNGLDPSESNPMFHQQMVYAVTMTTIKNFERALGRKVLWSSRRVRDPDVYEEYVDKLRVYPHALREANAYYSPQKKALLFGYFHSNPIDQSEQMPGSLVFTCLSHDIIAHETTHAILDGMQMHYNEPTNPDVLAFHEAFADIVALFQHFSFPEVLRHQIALTRGDLSSRNLLGELAMEFGVAIGQYGSLRSAIGSFDEVTKKWEPIEPDPNEYHETTEPHHRGSILVAAVFEAFLAVYNRRVADLFRIASNGTGVLPGGELHPDLVERLSDEAAKVSSHILHMCIRAIDYCPPVDITFGDYLRAIITADVDLVREDHFGYRLAFIEAFKRRGIFPSMVKSLSIESLHHPEITISQRSSTLMGIVSDFLRDYSNMIAYHGNRKVIHQINKAMISGEIKDNEEGAKLRRLMGLTSKDKILGLHKRIGVKFDGNDEFIGITGLALTGDWYNLGIRTSMAYQGEGPSFQIKNLRLVSRVGPKGDKVNQIVFSIVQRCGVVMKNGIHDSFFIPGSDDEIPEEFRESGFIFRFGSTLILDLNSRELKYAVSKPLLIRSNGDGRYEVNKDAIEKQWGYLTESYFHYFNEFQQYFGAGLNNYSMEPFSLLHQH